MTSSPGQSRTGILSQIASTYLKARWFLGSGLIVLAIVVMAAGAGSDYTWVVAVAGGVIVAHAFAMTVWRMHEPSVALLIDLTAALLASFMTASSSNDHSAILLTFVGGAVLIALFSESWARTGIIVYVAGFSLASLLIINDWDLTLVLGDFLGSLFVVALIIGVTSVIRRHLIEIEAARAQTIGVVSHELRNHLAGVIGATELVREPGSTLDPAEVDEMLELAFQQAVEAGEVIDDLLVASRAERGVLDALPELVDLRPLTTTVIQRTSVNGRAIISDFPDTPTWALADPLRYKQIVRNLLTNALRYGGETIRVSLETVHDNVSLVVADDGDGVEKADESAIFQPYRGGKNIDHVAGSSGLGLWIARSLAHKMHGNLTYRRESGQTVFELVLPGGDDPDARTDTEMGSVSAGFSR